MTTIKSIVQCFFFIYLVFSFGCQPETKTQKEELKTTKIKSLLGDQQPKNSTHTGTPKTLTDSTITPFFDKDASFGYALPDANSKDYLGSFIGPYMKQVNGGTWWGQSMSKLALFDGKQKIDLKSADIIAIGELPNQLIQVFVTKSPQLRVETALSFANENTAKIKLLITNLEPEKAVQLTTNFTGVIKLDNTDFALFKKNIGFNLKSTGQQILMFALAEHQNIKTYRQPQSYSWELNQQSLAPNEQFEYDFCHVMAPSLQELSAMVKKAEVSLLE